MTPRAEKGGPAHVLEGAKQDRLLPSYLFIGQSPLVKPKVRALLEVLLPGDSSTFNLEVIPPEAYSDEALFQAVATAPFLPGRKVVLLEDPPALEGTRKAGTAGEKQKSTRIFRETARMLSPSRCVLVVRSETADRNSPLFKMLKEKGALIDLELKGSDRRGRLEAARSFARKRLSEAGKALAPGALDLLVGRAGTDLVALEAELDKLVAAAGDRRTIGPGDVEELVARHRDRELYELTEAINAGDPRASVSRLRSLLGQGYHPLAILQVLGLHLQRLLLVKDAAAHAPRAGAAAAYGVFRDVLLPALRSYWGEPLPPAVKGVHPYQLYKVFQVEGTFRNDFLTDRLLDLVHVDLDLKGGSKAPEVVLESLVIRLACRS